MISVRRLTNQTDEFPNATAFRTDQTKLRPRSDQFPNAFLGGQIDRNEPTGITERTPSESIIHPCSL